MLLLILSADGGVVALKQALHTQESPTLPNGRKDKKDSDMLSPHNNPNNPSDQEIQDYIDATVRSIMAGEKAGFHLYSQDLGVNATGTQGPLEKKAVVFGTVCLITGLVLAAVRLGSNAYESSFKIFTGQTLTELGSELNTAMADINTKLTSLITLVESRKKNWASTADELRALLHKEQHPISKTLQLYVDNLFPATTHAQAAAFKAPNPVVTDLNTDNIESILQDILDTSLGNMKDNIASELYSKAVDGILQGIGYSGAAAAITGYGLPVLGLIQSLYKTGQTLHSLTDTLSSCTNKLQWTRDELEVLVKDANFEMCSLFRSTRVFARMHKHIHSYILDGGEEPSPQVRSLWDTLGLSIDFFDDELESMWQRGWCEIKDTRASNTEISRCISGDPTRDNYMCAVEHIWVDDFLDANDRRTLDIWGHRYQFNASNTKRKSTTRYVRYNTVPIPSRGGLVLGEPLVPVPMISQLVQVDMNTLYSWQGNTVQGLYQNRSFFPTTDLQRLSNSLREYTVNEYEDPGNAHLYPADFYRDPLKPEYHDQRLYLAASRSGGAPVVSVEFCDPKKKGDGWYSVPLASMNKDDMCPNGGRLTDNYFWGKWYLCIQKDWSMIDTISPREVSEAEKVFFQWVLKSQTFP